MQRACIIFLEEARESWEERHRCRPHRRPLLSDGGRARPCACLFAAIWRLEGRRRTGLPCCLHPPCSPFSHPLSPSFYSHEFTLLIKPPRSPKTFSLTDSGDSEEKKEIFVQKIKLFIAIEKKITVLDFMTFF